MKENKEQLRYRVSRLLDEAYTIRINNLKESVRLAEEALELSKSLSDEALIAKSLSVLSLFHMIMADYDESMKLSEEAITLFEKLGDDKGVADAKYNIAGIYYKTDDLHLGLMYLIDCLLVYRKYKNYHQMSRTLKSLGTIYEYFGDEKRAVSTYLEAVEAARKTKDKNLESNAMNPLSGIYLNKGEIDKALKVIQKSIEMKKETEDIRGLAFALYGRGKVYTATGDFEKAEADLFRANEIHEEMGEKLGIGMGYHKMGYLYMKWGKLEEARKYLEMGADFGDEYSIALIKFKCNYFLYKIHKDEGDNAQALKYLEHYLKEKEMVINAQTMKVIENYELITKMDSMEKEAELLREKEKIIEKKNMAEQKAMVKQEFLSTMSHEIRTPLNAVITISSMLSDREDEEEQQLLDSLNFSAKNLLYIINDILDFTKLDSGKVNLDHRPVDFTSLLKSITQTYDSLAREKGVELKLEVSGDVRSSYKVDETKFAQIIGNLISNAIKFTESGTVTFSVSKVATNKRYDKLHFLVEDTGDGIDKEFLTQIFDSFSQPKMIKTRKHGGSGLGLAIVKKLVNLFGSDIYVESELGKGSRFYFDLALEHSVLPEKVPGNFSEELSGKCVLLAEDNRINAMVLGKVLKKWGVEHEVAENGRIALEMANKKNYDFILMDIHMPEMDGFEATKRLRSDSGLNSTTPVFALTADITAEQQNEFETYFDGFLLKPIEREKLYEALLVSHTKA